MSLTREEADQIVKEALAQGWAEEANAALGSTEEGYIHLHDFGVVPDRGGNSGCVIELKFPGMWSDSRYYVRGTDEWRRLKAKVDEMKEIVKQAGQRGWGLGPRALKVGKFGMMVEVIPPGVPSYYPKRIGNMTNWRKLCREFDDAITITPETHRLQEG